MNTLKQLWHEGWPGQLRRLAVAFSVFFMLVLNFAAPYAAALTSLSEGYSSSTPLAQGAIVSLVPNKSDQIQGASSVKAKDIYGVVVSNGGSLFSVQNGNGSNQLQVATSGIAGVLVSDINGTIHDGDEITASPITGIGMKATTTAKVIGIAQGTSTNDTKTTYKDPSGHNQTVTLGMVPVVINVSYFYKQPEKTLIPGAIQNIANALVGKSVSPIPILISGVIFIVTLIIVSSIIFSMIRSSIISVGRNPMSQSAVYRDVIQLSVLVLAILAVAVVSIYIVLKNL